MNDDDEARHHPLDDCDHDDDASPESERDAYLEHLDAEPRGPRYARRSPAPVPFDSAQQHLEAHLARLGALMTAAEPAEQLAEDPKRELDEDLRTARAATKARFIRRVAGELLEELRAREAVTTAIPLPIRDLKERFRLSQLELDVLLLVASPHLQRDFRGKWRRLDPFVEHPLVHTIRKVLAPIQDEPHELEQLFWQDRALLHQDLLRIEPGLTRTGGQLAWEEPDVPLRVVALLMDRDLRGDLLARFATTRAPSLRLDQLVLPAELRKAVSRTLRGHARLAEHAEAWGLRHAQQERRALVVLLTGAPGSGKRAFAEALATAQRQPILELDADRMRALAVGRDPRVPTDLVELFERVAHEARIAGALVLLPEAERLFTKRRELASHRLLPSSDPLAPFDGVLVFTSAHPERLDPRVSARVDIELALPSPSAPERLLLWRRALPSGLPLGDDVDLAKLAERYVLGPGAIHAAVFAAAREALGRRDDGVVMRDLERAATRAVERAGSWRAPERSRHQRSTHAAASSSTPSTRLAPRPAIA